MSPGLTGGLLGLGAGLGAALVVVRLAAIRRMPVAARVLPYVRDLVPAKPSLSRPLLRWTADLLDRTLGGAVSVQRRLDRAGLAVTVPSFRVEQLLWGLGGFGAAAGYALLRTWVRPTAPLPLLLLCLGGFGCGLVLRDQRLSASVKRREAAMLAEFPAVAELLALSVAAGEAPVAALDRVVRRSGGELSGVLAEVLARVRSGDQITDALDRLAATTGVPVVARFAQGIAVAIERGTPLADVLHAQAADVREAGRRALIEQASRKEIAMMAPVVLLVLPTTVFFAFWPGLVGLTLTR
jgi:tight adherence protein C